MSGASVYFKGYVSVLACAGLFVLLAIPLILRKIPRNAVYGYRTGRTLKSDAAWYAANAFFGWCVIGASVVSAIAVKVLYSYAHLDPNHYMTATIACLIGPLATAVAFTHFRILKIDGGP